MAAPPRVLLIGPLEGARWRSISHYTRTLAEGLRAHGVEVEVAAAPWWNPPSVLAGLRTRWTTQPAICAALRGEFDIVHLTDHALAHHVKRFAPRAAVVVTCHDLMAFTVPGYFHGRIEGAIKRAFLRKPIGALKRADAVIAVSTYTADAIESRGAAPAERVHVVPNIVRPAFHPLPMEEAEAFLAARGITLPPRPRILSVGHPGGYKNLPLLLASLAQPALANANLIRVGGLTSGQNSRAHELAIDRRITLLRNPDDPTLAALYNVCDVLIQPSLAEGFGLPVAEAMACGLPVVVSDGGALPEVVAEAAIVIPIEPHTTASDRLATGAASLLDPAAAARARLSGIVRAAAFTPEVVVPQLLGAYAQAQSSSIRPKPTNLVDS